MRGLACLVILVCCLGTACSASADSRDVDSRSIPPRSKESTAKGRALSERRGSNSGNWTTVTAALVVVVVLILLAAKVLQKRGMLAPGELSREAVHVLGRKVIDYRNTIHLVQCGSRVLVLGSSQSGLVSLSEITEPAEVEALVEQCHAREPTSVADGWGEMIRRLRTGPSGAKSPPRDVDPPVLRLRQRLATVERRDDDLSDPSSIREGA